MIKQLLISTRFGNLIMIAVFMYLAFKQTISENSNNWSLFCLYSSSVILIAFTGYLINDYFDQKIDAINRPGKNLFEIAFLKRYGLIFYVFLNVLALVLLISHYWLMAYSSVFIVLLLLYAAIAKSWPIIGNLMVALCMSFTVYPFLLIGSTGRVILMSYIIFAFIISMAREMVKDMQDIEGDKSQNLKTAAIIFPISMNKAMIISFLLCLIFGLGYVVFLILMGTSMDLSSVSIYYLLFLMLPISTRAIYMTAKASEKEDWHKLSNWLKMIMLAGIMSLGVI